MEVENWELRQEEKAGDEPAFSFRTKARPVEAGLTCLEQPLHEELPLRARVEQVVHLEPGVDRIGAKAETARQPIHVYIPFVAETQDEKMYRVVMDRERWFNVVMGEDYKVDIRTTEKLATRIPLPAAAASALTFRLNVVEAVSDDNACRC